MTRFLIVATLALAACGTNGESTDDAITRIDYESAMDFVSETISQTSCEVWAESPDTFTSAFVRTFARIPVEETGQTYGQVVSEAQMTRDLTAEMEDACQ